MQHCHRDASPPPLAAATTTAVADAAVAVTAAAACTVERGWASQLDVVAADAPVVLGRAPQEEPLDQRLAN